MTTMDWSGRWDGGYSIRASDSEDHVLLSASQKGKEPWSATEYMRLRPDAIPALATAIRLLRELAAKEAKGSPEAVGA